MTTSPELVVALANIRHDMTRAEKADDIEAFARMITTRSTAGGDAPDPWIAVGVEIDNPDSRHLWHSLMPDGEHLGGATETPVVVSTDWVVLGHRIWHRTDGVAGVDPDRRTVEVLLQHPTTAGKVTVLATHMDHLAFSGGLLAGTTRSQRRAKWTRHLKADRRRILRLRLAGHLVIHAGDLNHGLTKYGAGQQTSRDGVMQITILPPLAPALTRTTAGQPGRTVRLGKATALTGHTDHQLLAVPVSLTAAPPTGPSDGPSAGPLAKQGHLP